MGPQPLPKHVVHQVSGTVVPLDVLAPRSVDSSVHRRGLECVTQRAAQYRALGILTDRVDVESPPVAGDRTGVADLTTGLDIEGIFPQKQVKPEALLPEGEHVSVGLGACVPNEPLLAALHAAPLAG